MIITHKFLGGYMILGQIITNTQNKITTDLIIFKSTPTKVFIIGILLVHYM